MALLALQFGLQPLFTKGCITPTADKVPLVLLCESLKAAMALLLLLTEGGSAGLESLKHWSAAESLTSGAVPAALYAIQNVCIQVGYQHTSALHFNLLNQSKIIFTAIAAYFILGKRQSRLQVLSLTILFVIGAILSQPPGGGGGGAYAPDTVDFNNGILPNLLAALLSGIGSVWAQRVMQGVRSRHAYLYSLELGVYSTLLLAGQMLWSEGGSVSSSVARLGKLVRENPICWLPLASNAAGGIFTGQVVKYAGGVRRSFAVIGGIITTGLAESLVGGARLSRTTVMCLPMVLCSIYLYASQPPEAAFKKTRVD